MEACLDDNYRVPDEIMNMPRERLDKMIEELEAKARIEKNRILQVKQSGKITA